MRKLPPVIVVAALSLAGIAYAAATVTNIYTISARITPVKSGTKSKPNPISQSYTWSVSTAAPGQRPAVVRGFQYAVSGIVENTDFFPACSSSTLETKGPGGCRSGSKLGTGLFGADLAPSGDFSDTYAIPCRLNLDIFNGGSHNILLYFSKPASGGCPLPRPLSVVVQYRSGNNLIGSYSLPSALLHPTTRTDLAMTHQTFSIANKSVVRKGKKIGLFATNACPPNHQRQIAVTFTREDGIGRIATEHVACT